MQFPKAHSRFPYVSITKFIPYEGSISKQVVKSHNKTNIALPLRLKLNLRYETHRCPSNLLRHPATCAQVPKADWAVPMASQADVTEARSSVDKPAMTLNMAAACSSPGRAHVDLQP